MRVVWWTVAGVLAGCAPSVPDGAQTRSPVAEPARPEMQNPPSAASPSPPSPPQVSGEELIRELEALSRKPATRAELDAFIAAHPDVATAEAKPYGPALMWALEFAQEETALALVAAGAKIPDAALGLAARGGLDAFVKALLARGAAADAGNSWGYTPLHAAAKYGHASTIEILLAAGATPSVRASNDGFTPLHLAVIDRRLEAVRALIRGKADLEARDDRGRTPLHWGPFAYSPKPKHVYADLGGPHGTMFTDPGPAVVIDVLVEAGAEIEARDEGGNTPLHEAAAIGSRRGVEALLARGAQAGVKNAAGETPLTIAKRRGDEDIAKLLR